MQPRKNFRELLSPDKTLVMPGAQDALSARLIQQTGFEAFFIGGFQVAGTHYALPDLGLISLGDFIPIVRNILNASSLPVLLDIDDGYGDVKNVVHTLILLMILFLQLSNLINDSLLAIEFFKK